MNNILLYNMISLGLLFVLVATGAWRKSYTTTAYVSCVAVGVWIVKNIDVQMGLSVVVAGAFFSVARAILQLEHDRLIKDN